VGISFNAASLLNGNGIDVDSVVSELQAASQGQITTLQNQQSALQTQASDLTSINTDLNSLATSVQALTDPLGAFSALTANSSLPAVVTATANSSATAGNYTMVVSGLASAGTVYSAPLADSTTTSVLPSGASSGELQLQVGGSTGSTYNIQITAGQNDTLTNLASYINQQSTANNWGVTATVLNDASGARLAITSNATGSTGALAITQNTTLDSNGNPTGTATNLTFETPVGGTNATFTVNGIPFSSTSNTVTSAIPGVTLNLVSAYSGEAQISVTPDTSAITSAVSSFVSAYNQVVTDINNQFAYSSSTGSQGPLGSDVGLENLQSSLLADATYAVSGNSAGYTNLASLGINMQNDGTLSIDSQTLASAIASNPSAVQSFFQNATSGFATNFNTDLTNLTNPTSGPLNIDLTQNQAEQNDLSNQISEFQQQLATQKQNLIQEFSAVNASLEEYPFLLQEVLSELGSTSPTSSDTTPTSGTSTSSTSSSTSSGS
jgi:flagellar hook-associated protein 2